MSSIDLIIIGFLLNKEKSAYDMVKELESWNIIKWVKISTPTIYKNVIKLQESGYLDSRVVREGQMPEKTIYSINKKGEKYFLDLMQNYSSNVENIYFSFSAFIVNINQLDDETRKGMLLDLNKQIEKCKKQSEISYIREEENIFEAYSIVNLYSKIYGLLYEWSSDILKHYYKD